MHRLTYSMRSGGGLDPVYFWLFWGSTIALA